MFALVRSLWLAALLARRCGAWVFPTTSPQCLLLSSGHKEALRPTACVMTNARCPFSPTIPNSRQRGRKPSTPLRAEPLEAGSLEVDSHFAGETADTNKGTEVTARLHKPVGLMLAETEPGKPGLIVDELVEGGSAEQCGIVSPGMVLISACGVDCSELGFEEVVEMMQSSPPDAPIDFVFRISEP